MLTEGRYPNRAPRELDLTDASAIAAFVLAGGPGKTCVRPVTAQGFPGRLSSCLGICHPLRLVLAGLVSSQAEVEDSGLISQQTTTLSIRWERIAAVAKSSW